MIRALFILLAIVSLVLGFVLNNPLLYAAAGALLLLTAIMVIVAAVMRRKNAKKSFAASSGPHDELAALGISEVRPKSKSPQASHEDEDVSVVEAPSVSHRRQEGRTAVSSPDAALTETEPAARAVGEGAHLDGILNIRPLERQQRSTAQKPSGSAPDASHDGGIVEAELDEDVSAELAAPAKESDVRKSAAMDDPQARERLRREVLDPLLQSAQAAIGANTVCLFRREDGALKYHIEAVVSKNAYARTKGHFTTRVPLVTPAIQSKVVITFRVGEKGIPTNALAYYVEPIAVRQIAVTEVPQRSSDSSYFLLADTMEEGGLGDEKQHGLLVRFARVLASVLDGGEPIHTSQREAEVRPRRDIIAEEMELARAEGHPLALILVYLNAAEEIAAEGDESVNEAEAILEGRIRDAASGKRVEHFGELIYAVFFVGDAIAVEAYVVELQEALRAESGPLAGDLSIGVAFLKKRHDTPESFRADANEALREAYETGACTILE